MMLDLGERFYHSMVAKLAGVVFMVKGSEVRRSWRWISGVLYNMSEQFHKRTIKEGPNLMKPTFSFVELENWNCFRIGDWIIDI